jgi:glucosylceramidase
VALKGEVTSRRLEKKMKKIINAILGLLLAAVSNAAQTVEWISSTANAPWVVQTNLSLARSDDDKPLDLVVRLDKYEQTIDGWGGCFNELGWLALQSASPDDRQEVLRQLFAPGAGLNFTICRMPIGASDYATNWYSLDDTPGDFELKHFSLDRDRSMLLPYIKAAMKYQAHLKIWGSPWSPPAWLKVNQTYNRVGTTNRLIQDGKHLTTHARYFAKYVQAYRAEGVDVFAVAVQNEPFSSQVFPSCVWSPTELRDFIGKYVGPTFKREKLDAQIWLGTFNNSQFPSYDASLSDPRAAKYISAVGLQWAGKDALPEIREHYPRRKIVQTESECGNGSFDWNSAEYTFSLMKYYFNHGVSLYAYWNMVLDETGSSSWGWKQNALVTVNQTSGKVTYTPEFYLFKHVAHFVPAGSVRLDCYGNFDNALAFLTPDERLILLAVNVYDYPVIMAVNVGNRCLEVKLPAKSFNTFQVSGVGELESH